MAGIADMYKDENTASKDRLLSARSGVSNILQNAQQTAGWAAPGVAVLQGQQAAMIGEENERKTKESEFMTTWGKLLAANPGAANKFWNTHAEEAIGTKIKIDQSEFNPKDGYKLKLNTGHEVDVRPDGKAYGILKDGTFGVIDADTLAWYNEQAKDLIGTKAAASGKGASEKNKRRATLEKEYGDLINKAASAKLSGGTVLAPGEIKQNEARRAQIEADYLKEYGTPISKAPAAPAPTAMPPAQGGGLLPSGPAMLFPPGQGIGAMRPQAPAPPVQKKPLVF
jgi:hypothetical protein